MSDMTSQVQPHGELGVKAAWAACAVMALKDGFAGWEHRPTGSTYRSAEELLEGEREPMPWDIFFPKLPQLQMGACGLASAAMCVAYMMTGMSGLEWHALPDNPGAVYKSHDIVYKHYVWSKWGYGQNSMRV
ncbi:hypothetical protein DUNSADRAFT_13589 [Dunaliella salina]|uniref:Glutathione gamma-glutamylcysteinyltransferase n=1 Tax=Dunaliella salina TaxID=3046 RepID=A0ABQ7H374_DUNSA|nr:hypothetical protein DUNSADRAFT_13589 [Dunaliella salina]|eukprot:KAF5841315.1 hypothetical protein DUNSADRAFT_13589 [Dunaliella salina]